MNEPNNISYAVAFGAGFLMFLSPCILPLIPTYISYLTGISFKDMQSDTITPQERNRIRTATMIHSLMFIIGFSVIFVLLGTSVSYLGKVLFDFQVYLKKIGALLIIFFGLMIMGVLKIGFLEKEKKIEYRKKGITYLGSLLVGATFAIGWTPCVGPLLGSILVYASSTASMMQGMKLLTVFSLGLAVPFFLSAVLINSFILVFNKIKGILKWINLVGGLILIGFGIYNLIGR